METEYVTYRQWDSYAMRTMNKTLKERGSSLSFVSILNHVNSFVIEVQSDRKMMIVKKDWRKAMRDAALD